MMRTLLDIRDRAAPRRAPRLPLKGAAVLAMGLSLSVTWHVGPAAAALPEIRLHSGNTVPACVSSARLQRFLEERNQSLDPALKGIAAHYRQHGQANGIRWDYAFYQMLLETNYLSFRASARRMGDVSPRQYNFAGIGTTGGGVPGDRFPDASSGVLAHIQHLVAYAGVRVDQPVARRTREMQDDIIKRSQALRRPVNFADLSRRWAVDWRYARNIQLIADRFTAAHCHGPDPEPGAVPQGAIAAKAGAGSKGGGGSAGPIAAKARLPAVADSLAQCRVWTAGYGGEKNMLIRRSVGGELHLTALTVLDGQERWLAETFIRDHTPGGVLIGQYPSRLDALARAFELCPSAAGPPPAPK